MTMQINDEWDTGDEVEAAAGWHHAFWWAGDHHLHPAQQSATSSTALSVHTTLLLVYTGH